MLGSLTLSNAPDAFIPISRFNGGEALKIFDEVREFGYKIVVNNNTPACVMLTPERYQEMLEMIEDQYLFTLAEERLKSDSGKTYPADEVYKELNINPDAEDEIPMEYGVDFE